MTVSPTFAWAGLGSYASVVLKKAPCTISMSTVAPSANTLLGKNPETDEISAANISANKQNVFFCAAINDLLAAALEVIHIKVT